MKKIILIFMSILLMVSATSAESKQESPARLNVNKRMITNFFKSLIIPGWGQWEEGKKIRSIVYVTAEIATIYGYQSYYQQGADLEKTFKSYGDEHWYYGRWSPQNNGETACGGNLRTHQMPVLTDIDGVPLVDENGFDMPLKDHHFYENIGKYPEFSCGWDDMANEAYYVDMRTRSNELYKNARVSGTLIMVNHLISAFDAALGTDMTSFETSSYTGKLYINPLNTMNGITMEVKF